MSSTFYGLNIAKTGLYASQTAMELVGHNISNASTPGYTRQVLSQSAIEGMSSNSIIASGVKVRVGGGVSVDYIDQIRNQFLDSQYRTENSGLANWSVKADAFYYIENVFKEPSDSGISTVLNEFYSSLSSLSTKPSSEEIRNLVRQNAISVSETMQYYAKQLKELQKEQNDAIGTCVSEVNTIVKQIADLNKQIVKYERTGQQANDLNDKRNLLLDELSGLLDIEYEYNDQNEVSVYFGKDKRDDAARDAYCLLDANNKNATYEMSVERNKADYYGTANQLYTLTFASQNGDIEITGDSLVGGKIKGYFDLRDGNTNANMGIPYFMQKLDELTRGIVSAYNEVHKKGYTIPDGDAGSSKTGVNFFEDFGDISRVNASNMDISSEIKDSAWNIAASDTKVDMSASNTNEGNNKISLELEAISSSTTLKDLGSINDFLAGIVSELGVRADQCNDMNKSQELIVDNVDDLRMSVSGVSIDEEVTNLITFQRAYQASSRVLTSIDEMLDKLINGTGRVGL